MKLGRVKIEVNSSLCTGCRLCELVCSIFHEGKISLEKARIRISQNSSGMLFTPHICRLCKNPPCVTSCQSGALEQDIETGIILIQESLCTKCGLCIPACPYLAIQQNRVSQEIFICDRCGGEPTCVQFCFTGALKLTVEGFQP